MNYLLNIRSLIKEKKVKVFVLAQHLEVTPNTISNWLHENNPMSVNNLIKICDYLNVPYASVFEDVISKKTYTSQERQNFLDLMKENSKLKDKIISLQERLYENRSNYYSVNEEEVGKKT